MGREKNLSVGQFSLVCLCAVGLILPVSTMWSRAETIPAKSAELKYQEIPVSLISETSQLTFAGDKAGEGYFSQDGKKMIFQSERPLPADLQKKGPNPFYQIYLMDLKSGKTELVSPGMGKTTCSWIHPDLKRALFSSTHLDPQFPEKVKAELEQRRNPVKKGYAWSFDDQYDIFSVDLRTKKLTQLTHELGYDAEASYSPDGKWIVFASNRAGYDPQQLAKLSAEDRALFAKDPSYLMDLYLMAADGTHVQQLTTTLGYDGGPFFSSDGKKITWRRFSPNGAQAEIMTMDLATKVEKQVTSLGAMSWAPFFHPSGDYIVFTSSVLGYSNFELFAVDVEGKHLPIRVTKWEGFDGLPV
ncbi:MAG TPA: biopolymer transporter Tol, partial [Pseudobdellovibrionaceae bacterium]|nr:biopolymer transporter Tol [Pseudobdellovibrionaceae bacterium]